MAVVDVELKIKRYNPEQDEKPHWETYEVRVEDTDRVVDALHE
ncbi:MAG: succinate dehydrogenase iron-sulfur subunit, partial [Acidimicrobiia bacterium]|nr:succinate dehydrogenase iron-sulfur subunit [Acidimicrobiia bacterium]